MLNNELYQKSILPICESLTVKPALMGEFNIIYEKDKIKYYRKAKENPLYEEDYITHGSLEREVNIKRVLGIILCAEEDEGLRNRLVKLMNKYYPREFELIKKKPVDFHKILVEQLLPKRMSANWMVNNSHIRILYYIIRLLYGTDFEPIKPFEQLIAEVEASFVQIKNFRPLSGLENDRFNHPQYMSFIKAYEKKFTNFISCKDFSLLLDYSDGINLFETRFANEPQELKKNILTYIRFVGNIFDLHELSNTLLTSSISLSKTELRQIFKTIIFINRMDEEKFNALPESLITQLYFFGVYFQSILKEYKNAKEIYRKNNQETQFLEMGRILNENQTLKEENAVLNNKIEQLNSALVLSNNRLSKTKAESEKSFYEEIKRLKTENEKLAKDLEAEQRKDEELFQLREFVFSIKTDDDFEGSEKIEIEIPAGQKIILVGGHENWRKKVREKFPFLITVDGTNKNQDINVFGNADLVLFFTPHMNHATYYKILDYLTKNKLPYGYVYQQNLNLFEKQLFKELSSTVFGEAS